MKNFFVILCALLFASPAAQAGLLPIEPFPRNEVRLTPSVWLDAQKRDGEYLLSLEPDRLLHCFRVTAGLPARGASYEGWENAKAGLRGHVVGGHYLSALAMMYASTGDSRFKERGELMVADLAKCQAANPRGYVGAFPDSFFDTLEQGKRGAIPYYTIHKTLAGLVAQYEECGNAQALDVAKKLALYLVVRNEKFTHQQLLELHVSKYEAGGIVESLWDIYALTKEEKIKELAINMEQTLFLDDLANQKDNLTGRHGNTHIPLVLGAMRRYELMGEARYLELAKYFWDRVVVDRGWATGGTTGPGENWGEAGKLAGIMSLTTHETCKTHNLLRLSRKLFMATGDSRYADYYNRAHLNGILGTEGPEPGQLEYYVPMATGYHRWYGFPDKSMWCCYGTGMENFSKLGDSVFFRTDDALYINQFIPCVLDWKEKNFQLAIETKYPEDEVVNFVVKSGSGKLSLRILQPSWAGQGVAVSVNGKAVPMKTENGFIVVDGSWKTGDEVSVKFPMSLRSIPLPDDPQQVAIAYGPVILAGIVDRPNERAFMTARAADPQPDSERMKKAYYFLADSPDNLSWLKPVAGKPLHFQTEGQPFNISFQPFYSVTSERYGIYWPILAKDSDRQRGMDVENQTLDLLREMDAYKAGEQTGKIEQGFAKFITDSAVSAYHERLRLGMAKVFKDAGQDAKSTETLKSLAAPFIGFKRAEAIMAILGDEAETHGVRPLVMDDYDKYGDAAADRDIVDGVPVVKTKDARARYVYFGFTTKGKAALTRKSVRITMKYRCDSAPVLHYDSVTAPYASVKPTKIETVNGWKIATFDCPNALFAGRLNLHASLRVTASDSAILMIADLKAAPTENPSHAAREQAAYDLVIYGGTPAGITAAIAAAREGASVAVIEPSAHIGGMVSGGLSSTDTGDPTTIGGIAREFFTRADAKYNDPKKTATPFEFWKVEPHVAKKTFHEMIVEAGVKVVIKQSMQSVTVENHRIMSLTTKDGTTYRGKMFVDATYEGDLMARAGVKYTVGREGRDEYGESLAGFLPAALRPRTLEFMTKPGTDYIHGTPCELPARDATGKLYWGITDKPWPALGSGDTLVQSYNFRVVITRNKDNMVPFPKPKNYYPERYGLLLELIRHYPGIKFPRIVYIGWIPGGKSEINASGLIFSTDYWGGSTDYPEGDEATRARIWQDHIDYVQGLLWFLGHDERVPEQLRKETNGWGLCRDEFADNGHWPYALYVREARRMIGRYVMRQQDCQEDLTKSDAIAMGSFILDSHAYQRLVTPEGNVTDEGNFDVKSKPYQIPYRSITPQRAQCENLLVPVCLSATHVAYGSIRMEPVYMSLGHASGIAAVAALRADVAVQDIDVKTLLSRLLATKQVLSLPPQTKVSEAP